MRAKGHGIGIFGFSEQHPNLPADSDFCRQSTIASVTAGSREVAFLLIRNLPLSAQLKGYFIQVWLFWPHVVGDYLGRCSTSQVC